MKTAAEVRREQQLAGMSVGAVGRSLRSARAAKKAREQAERKEAAAENAAKKAALRKLSNEPLDVDTLKKVNTYAWHNSNITGKHE